MSYDEPFEAGDRVVVTLPGLPGVVTFSTPGTVDVAFADLDAEVTDIPIVLVADACAADDPSDAYAEFGYHLEAEDVPTWLLALVGVVFSVGLIALTIGTIRGVVWLAT